MIRILVPMVTILAVLGLSACGTIGKGKGKAPPPVYSPPPAGEIITK